jgi:hypothetical protein
LPISTSGNLSFAFRSITLVLCELRNLSWLLNGNLPQTLDLRPLHGEVTVLP